MEFNFELQRGGERDWRLHTVMVEMQLLRERHDAHDRDNCRIYEFVRKKTAHGDNNDTFATHLPDVC